MQIYDDIAQLKSENSAPHTDNATIIPISIGTIINNKSNWNKEAGMFQTITQELDNESNKRRNVLRKIQTVTVVCVECGNH